MDITQHTSDIRGRGETEGGEERRGRWMDADEDKWSLMG